MAGSLTKSLLGKEDCAIHTTTGYPSTFERLSSVGGTLTLTKLPDIWETHQVVINARAHNGGLFNEATILAAISYMNGANLPLYLEPGDWEINNDLTIPSNAHVIVPKGAKLIKNAMDVNITVNGYFNPGLYKVFEDFDSGDVSFGEGAIYKAHPEWFGALAGDSTDCTIALNSIVEAVQAGTLIYLLPEIYKITNTWTIGKQVRIEAQNTTINLHTNDVEAILLGGTGTGAMASYMEINGLKVTNNFADYTSSSKAGIHMQYSSYGTFRNVRSAGFDKGIHFDAYTFSTDLYNCKISDNHYGAYFEDTSAGDDGGINDITLYGCSLTSNGSEAGGDNARIIDGDNIKFYGGSNESAGTQGISTVAGGNQGVYDTVIDGVWFESNHSYDIKFNTLNRAFMKNTRHENFSGTHTPSAVYVAAASGELSVDGMTVRNTSTGVYNQVFTIDAGTAKVVTKNIIKDDAIKLYATSGTKIPVAVDDSNGMKRYIGICEILNEDFIDASGAWASTSFVQHRWTAGGTNGTVVIDTVTYGVNGVALLTTDTADNDSANIIYIPAIVTTSNDPIIEIRAKLDIITSAYLFFGLADAATNDKASMPNNYAGFAFDTDVNAANIYAVSNNDGAGEVATDTTIDLTATDYFEFRIDLTDIANPKFFIFGQEVASAHAGTVKDATVLYPFIHVQSLGTSKIRECRVDKVQLWQTRG